MLSDAVIALFVGFGAAMWTYIKFSHRSTGGEFIKNLAPAAIVGFMAFVISFGLITAFLQ